MAAKKKKSKTVDRPVIHLSEHDYVLLVVLARVLHKSESDVIADALHIMFSMEAGNHPDCGIVNYGINKENN